MLIRDVTSYLEEIAPLSLQEEYDNAGLIVGDPDKLVTGVMVSLDAIEEVIDDAIDKGCNLVVSHHPIVFRGIKKFNANNYVHRCIIKAIKHDIALYAIHTNLDNVLQNGVNQRICDRIQLSNIRILREKSEFHTHNDAVGSGCIGTLPQPMNPTRFLTHLKKSMNIKVIKHTKLLDHNIETVAVCGGSGSFLLPDAKAAKADCFVTSDYKYHEFFDADGQLMICDIGHYESEQYTIDLLAELLSKKFPTFALHFTKVNTNPVQYF